MFCNQCGSQNSEGSKFCYKCGFQLPQSQQSSTQNYGGNNPGNYSTNYSSNTGSYNANYNANNQANYSTNYNSNTGSYNASYNANNLGSYSTYYGGAQEKMLSFKDFYKYYTPKGKKGTVIVMCVMAYISAVVNLIIAFLLTDIFAGICAVGIFVCGLLVNIYKSWQVSVVLSIIYFIIWGANLAAGSSNPMSGLGAALFAVTTTIILRNADKTYKTYRSTGMIPDGYNTIVRDIPDDRNAMR